MNFKLCASLLALICTISFTVGCADTKTPAASDKLSVVCTLFPQYDWARQIIGENENVELTLLADNGADFHSYQPGTDDIVTITSCDVLIYVGGEADSWIEDALKNSVNPDMIPLCLTDIMGGALVEEDCLGEDCTADHNHTDGISYDEHVWLSLKNAMLFSNAISTALSSADADNAADYQENTQNYLSQLQSLDAQFQSTVDNAACKTVLFGDRFPFRYLMEDYGLTYYAAFPGCSAETDASFETIVALAEHMDEEHLPAICTIENSNSNIANAILSNTQVKNQKILTLDSMQSVSRDDIDGGADYLHIMEANLSTLSEALN